MASLERPDNIIDARERFSSSGRGRANTGSKRIDLGLMTLGDWGLDTDHVWNVNSTMSQVPKPHKGETLEWS